MLHYINALRYKRHFAAFFFRNMLPGFLFNSQSCIFHCNFSFCISII